MRSGWPWAAVLALGAAQSVAAAEAPGETAMAPRLAATLVAADANMALVELGGQQAWLRPGERHGPCVLSAVAASQAELACEGRALRLQLAPGAADGYRSGHEHSAPPPAVMVELPAGFIESLAARPQALALGLDLVPEVEDGSVRGWRVARLEASNPLYPLGLREDDLVIAVAGFPAAEPNSLAGALRALPAQGSFNVTLLRRQQLIDLSIVAAPAIATP
jgi:type II secretory pathway component PulC